MPPLKLAALREAVAKVAPQRLAGMDAERDAAFDQAAEEGTAPLRLFLKKWAAVIAIERRPTTAIRYHELEHIIRTATGEQFTQAAHSLGEIVRAAYDEVEQS
jgi:hypothetical protein